MRLFLEIRPAAGGEEAESFAMELLQTYLKFAKKHDINVKLLSLDKTKSIRLEGKEKVLKMLTFEKGVHRVQRFSKGKMHTSTVSVAVLEIKENEKITISDKDIEFSTFRSSGAGGQHVNKTESAVRIKHIPTQIVVTCQSERSQHLNKMIALEILQSQLNALKSKNNQISQNNERKKQIGAGQRAEAKRTYNFVRNEVIDHETGKKATIKNVLVKAELQMLQ